MIVAIILMKSQDSINVKNHPLKDIKIGNPIKSKTRKQPIYNKTKLPDHKRFIRKVTTIERGERKFCATCPLQKNTKDSNCCWICGNKDHYVDKCLNKSKKKMSLKFLNMNLEF